MWPGKLKSQGGKRSAGRAETTGSRLCAGGNSSRRNRTHDQMVQAARSGCRTLPKGAWPVAPPVRPN